MDPELREASSDLGGSRFTTFAKVTLPLSLPGVVTGCIFVFVPSLGNFVVPELLGGGKTVMVGNLVRDQFLKARDWPFGATLALFMVVLLVLLFALQSMVSRRYSLEAAPMRRARGSAGSGSPWAAALLFLYLPIATLVVTSFNSGRSALNLTGLSLRWYGELFDDADLGEALVNSLLVAFGAMVFSTVLGTMLAVGLVRFTRSTALDAFVMAPAILPDLVLAIGLLVLLRRGSDSRLGLGTVTHRARSLRHGVRRGRGAMRACCSSTAPWRRRRRTSAPAG